MSIRKRASKKAPNGYSYQVYFSYYDRYTDEKKMFSKSGFHTYEDAVHYEKTIMPRGWHHDKWNHCKMIGIEYLPITTYTVINGKDRFFFGALARRKN